MTTAVKPPGAASSPGPAPRAAIAPWPWVSLWPALLITLAFGPLLALHARMLWARPHYQFFPLVIPGAAALAWRSCRHLGVLLPGKRSTARRLAVAGWGLLAVGVVFVSPGFGMIGALVTLLAAIFALGGWRLVRAALPAWGFLWLAVPLPRSYDLQLITALQNLVSRTSGAFLDALRVYHVMEGNVVEVAGRRLLVDQACSGIYSLLTLLLGALFYSLWTRSSVARTLVLMAAACVWVILGNLARIVTVVLFYVRLGIDASSGFKHEAIGLIVFAMMLAMLGSTDRLYSFVAALLGRIWLKIRPGKGRRMALGSIPAKGDLDRKTPRFADPASEESGPATVGPDPRGLWFGSAFSAAAFGILLLPQWLMPGVDWKEVLTNYDVYTAPLSKLGEDALPAHWQSFDRTGFRVDHREMDDSWGENSRAWFYRKGYRGLAFSVDHQFVDWHELTVCYTSQGWQMTGRRVGASGDSENPGGKYLVVADFLNPEGRYGHLIYGMYGRDGRPFEPPESVGMVRSLTRRLIGWFGRSSKGQSQAVARLNHQVQLFVESESPLSPADREQVLALYDHLLNEVHQKGLGIGEVSQ